VTGLLKKSMGIITGHANIRVYGSEGQWRENHISGPGGSSWMASPAWGGVRGERGATMIKIRDWSQGERGRE